MQQEYLLKHGKDQWRACDLGASGGPLAHLQDWARMRVQGGLMMKGNDVPPYCRMCGGLALETTTHILTDCPRGTKVVEDWAERWAITIPPRGG